MIYKRGEVYYIDLGNDYNTSVQRGTRPCVIIGNDVGNANSPILEVVSITTATKNKLPTHVTINEIKVQGTALCEQVLTVKKEKVKDRITVLPDNVMEAINRAICVSLNLNYVHKITKDVSGQEISFPLSIKLMEYANKIKELAINMEKAQNNLDKLSVSNINITGIDSCFITQDIKDMVLQKASIDMQKRKEDYVKQANKILGIVTEDAPKTAIKKPIMEKSQVNNRGRKSKYSIEEIAKYLRDGKTQREIADIFGVHYSAISKFIKNHNIEISKNI